MIPIGSDVKLSIIVPVYQVEKHLKNCVDSILDCKTDAVEILLVDDGSTDGSPAICDAYEKQYDNIRVIRKENGGLASARNAGLNAASGRYITFIDSDDTVESGFADCIIEHIDRGDDIIVFPLAVEYTQTNYIRKTDLADLCSVDPAQAVSALETSGMFNMSCSKVYRREMLTQQPCTEFEPHTEPGEDLIFNCRCFVKAKTVTLVNRHFYHWIRRGEDSLANRFRKDLFEKNKMFIEHRNRLYDALGMTETDYPLLAKGNLAYIFACIPNMYRGKNKFPRKERIAFYNEILQSKDVADWLAAAEISGSLMRQFKRLYGTGSAFAMDAYYSAALWGRNSFDSLWQIIRKRMKR